MSPLTVVWIARRLQQHSESVDGQLSKLEAGAQPRDCLAEIRFTSAEVRALAEELEEAFAHADPRHG